jgi:hypothetical protein
MSALIEVIVTDMGNGGAYCSECGCCLDGGNPLNDLPTHCPQCNEQLTGYAAPFINMGGSD